MDKLIKISEEDYSQLENEAIKVLENMNPESIEKLRVKCSSGIKEVTSLLEERLKIYKDRFETIDDWVESESKSVTNEFNKAKKYFWLTQIANFIATAVFKVPREFTPTVGYPYGTKELSNKATGLASKMGNEVKSSCVRGIDFCQKTLQYFYEMNKNILENDNKLMVFCESCDNIKNSNLNLNPDQIYKKMVSFLYLNNIEISLDIYSNNFNIQQLADKFSSVIDDINKQYKIEKGKEKKIDSDKDKGMSI